MKTVLIIAALALAAAPSFAQSPQTSPRVYAEIAGGAAVSPDGSRVSADIPLNAQSLTVGVGYRF